MIVTVSFSSPFCKNNLHSFIRTLFNVQMYSQKKFFLQALVFHVAFFFYPAPHKNDHGQIILFFISMCRSYYTNIAQDIFKTCKAHDSHTLSMPPNSPPKPHMVIVLFQSVFNLVENYLWQYFISCCTGLFSWWILCLSNGVLIV